MVSCGERMKGISDAISAALRLVPLPLREVKCPSRSHSAPTGSGAGRGGCLSVSGGLAGPTDRYFLVPGSRPHAPHPPHLPSAKHNAGARTRAPPVRIAAMSGGAKRRRIPRENDNLPSLLWAGEEYINPLLTAQTSGKAFYGTCFSALGAKDATHQAEPGGCCSPRHRMPSPIFTLLATSKGAILLKKRAFKVRWMTWRAGKLHATSKGACNSRNKGEGSRRVGRPCEQCLPGPGTRARW